MGDVKLPEDYAIDGLSLEADRRAKQLGRPYSYGQLIADTTENQREEIVEDYRVQAEKAERQGRCRVNSGVCATQKISTHEAENKICKKLEAVANEDRPGEK